jgi:hypothetical protein
MSFKHLEVSEIDQFANDFMEIYNDAWQNFENFVPIELATSAGKLPQNENHYGS